MLGFVKCVDAAGSSKRLFNLSGERYAVNVTELIKGSQVNTEARNTPASQISFRKIVLAMNRTKVAVFILYKDQFIKTIVSMEFSNTNVILVFNKNLQIHLFIPAVIIFPFALVFFFFFQICSIFVLDKISIQATRGRF